MNKYIFCIFIFLVIISLLILYFRKIDIKFESFHIPNSAETRAAAEAAFEGALESAYESPPGSDPADTDSTPPPPKQSFLIYEDRYYLINTDYQIYCRYISGGKWFKLCENYEANTTFVSTNPKDLTILRDSNNNLYIYVLFGNFICRKLVDDLEDTWENMTQLNIGIINQITSNKNYLIMNVPSVDEESETEDIGVFIYNIDSDDGSPTQIDQSISYVNLRVNPYSTEDYLYGLYRDNDGDIIPVKKSFSEATGEDEDYDDSFEFGEITFVDLFVTDNFVYGLGDDKYVYQKSIKVDVVGNESYTWSKVTTALSSKNSLINNINKKISIYNGYIYCFDNDTIKKHRINGYSWIDIDDFIFENQYYSTPPVTMLEKIHSETDKNMVSNVRNTIPMGPFSYENKKVKKNR